MLGYPLAELGLSGRAGCFADPQRALATLDRHRRLGMDAADGADPRFAGLKTLPTDTSPKPPRRRRERAATISAHGAAALIPRPFSRSSANDGRLPVFDIIFVTTSGGPADATNTLMIYGVKQGSNSSISAPLSAVSTVIVICILLMATAFIAVLKPGGTGMFDRDGLLFLIARRGDLCCPRGRARAGRVAVLDRIQAAPRHLRFPADVLVHTNARQF
jgi:multiple sugar transport system permease protein